MAGSKDGINWNMIKTHDYSEVPNCKGNPIVFNVNTNEKYSYFRLIIIELDNYQTMASISQLNIFGMIEQTINKEAFSSIRENFYSAIINDPVPGKYINDECSYNSGNNVFTEYQDAVDSLRRTYPKCQGITKETINTETSLLDDSGNPIVKKSVQYTLRESNKMVNFSDLEQKTTTDQSGNKTWRDNVSTWTTQKAGIETFDPIYIPSDIVNNKIVPLKQINIDYNAVLDRINTRYNDISGNVNLITNTQGTGLRDIMSADSKYEYSATSSSVLLPKKPDLQAAKKDDSISMLSQQNSVFILGTICSTALLILAISLASE